jgi:CrcB protein
LTSVLAVAAGGALGSVLRYGFGLALLRGGASSTVATFSVNVTGALALGFLGRYFAPPHGSQVLFLALTVELCGGYTTFSTFTLDMFTLVERGEVARAVVYALASVALSYGALVVGYQVARALRPLP